MVRWVSTPAEKTVNKGKTKNQRDAEAEAEMNQIREDSPASSELKRGKKMARSEPGTVPPSMCLAGREMSKLADETGLPQRHNWKAIHETSW